MVRPKLLENGSLMWRNRTTGPRVITSNGLEAYQTKNRPTKLGDNYCHIRIESDGTVVLTKVRAGMLTMTFFPELPFGT